MGIVYNFTPIKPLRMKTHDTQYPTIYVDEAGNTGSNICDESQKYFILSAISFSEEELNKIITDIPYNKELHFIEMKNSIAGRKAIKDILSHSLMTEQHISYQFINKSFCICAQIIDFVIEPVFHFILKENLYKKKNNIVLANLLYVFLVNHKEKWIVEDFLKSFMNMMRNKTGEDIDNFYTNTYILYEQESSNNGLRDILSTIIISRSILEHILIEDNKYSLDTTLTSLINMTDHWGKVYNTKLNILTDNSKPLAYQKDIIQKLSTISQEKLVGYDTRKHKYPLPINSFEMVDSSTSIGIQIADLVASAVAFRWNTTTKFESFRNELIRLNFFNIPCYPIRPADYHELEEMLKTQEDSKDIDPLDFLADNL